MEKNFFLINAILFLICFSYVTSALFKSIRYNGEKTQNCSSRRVQRINVQFLISKTVF